MIDKPGKMRYNPIIQKTETFVGFHSIIRTERGTERNDSRSSVRLGRHAAYRRIAAGAGRLVCPAAAGAAGGLWNKPERGTGGAGPEAL